MYISANTALRVGVPPTPVRFSPSRPCTSSRRGLRGLGLDAQTQSIASAASSALSLTGVLLASSLAIPILGPIAAGIAALGITLANVFSGCGQSCVEATSIVNQAEPLLQQNVGLYLSSPTRTVSMQAAALNNFDATWAALVRACQQVGGQGGAGCISGRDRNGCDYKTSPPIGWTKVNGAWQYQGGGPNGSGTSCWNWFVGYRDPIANDPGVVPDPSPLDSAASSIGSSLSSALGVPANVDLSGLLIPAALVGAGLFLFNGKK